MGDEKERSRDVVRIRSARTIVEPHVLLAAHPIVMVSVAPRRRKQKSMV